MAKRLQCWSDKWIGNIKWQIAMALELILRLVLCFQSLRFQENTCISVICPMLSKVDSFDPLIFDS